MTICGQGTDMIDLTQINLGQSLARGLFFLVSGVSNRQKNPIRAVSLSEISDKYF